MVAGIVHVDLFFRRSTISRGVIVNTAIERGVDLSNWENKVSLEH